MNDFDHWNTQKQVLESDTHVDRFPKVGEVWMSAFGRNLGFEQNGSGDNFSRPVLIIKKFNNQMFWAVPLSTKQKSLDFYYNFTDHSGTKVSAILAQLKLVSVKRLRRKMNDMHASDLQAVLEKLKSFL